MKYPSDRLNELDRVCNDAMTARNNAEVRFLRAKNQLARARVEYERAIRAETDACRVFSRELDAHKASQP